jgi:hypothetical protein
MRQKVSDLSKKKKSNKCWLKYRRGQTFDKSSEPLLALHQGRDILPREAGGPDKDVINVYQHVAGQRDENLTNTFSARGTDSDHFVAYPDPGI